MYRVTEKPEPREVSSWQAAEVNAADWMRYWGFLDARVTQSGSDGGIDVRATGAVAQVKREAKAVGRPAVQNLVGARGRDASLHLLFFWFFANGVRLRQPDEPRAVPVRLTRVRICG
jgi:hypothetical protein